MDNINESNSIVNQAKLIGELDKILRKKSIAMRVSDIQQLKGPLGIISGVKWDSVSGKMQVAKSEVTAQSQRIDTEFTKESIQDLQALYNENFYSMLSHYLLDELTYKIDESFISMIKDRAVEKTALSFAGADFNTSLWAVGQSISISVSKGLNDLPISDNRSPLGWAIVSSNVAALLAGTLNDSNSDGLDDDSPSYLGRIAGIEYYIDFTHPNDGIDSVIFGIKGNGFSRGSTIFCPYQQTWIESINSNTGEDSFFLLNRAGIAINPLDNSYYDNGNGASAFIGKFNVDLSDLDIFK